MRLAELPRAARAAEVVLRRFAPPPIVEHSVRSWQFALAFAEVDGVDIRDGEALAVAALLHDIALVPDFDAVRMPYEFAGGSVAWAVAAGGGWPAERCDLVARIVELHMAPSTDPARDPEGYLLDVATGLDISGKRADDLPEPFLREVLAAHPREGLAEAFGAAVTDQAVRKPSSQARRVAPVAVRALAHHPLDALMQPPAPPER